MREFASFGDPTRFEIAVRWIPDGEPRTRRPADHGWSMGDLKITICGNVITKVNRGAGAQSYIGWYLEPFFCWLADNWIWLLHEEDFTWPEKAAVPAAIACYRAMDGSIGLRDVEGKAQYRDAQAWYRRHSLRAAAAGGLFPDLFIRRLVDEIELSWSSQAPLFAPAGHMFATEPGFARLPVSDVAAPLWEALNWAASVRPSDIDTSDEAQYRQLARKIEKIARLGPVDFERAYVTCEILEDVRSALERANRGDLVDEHIEPGRPYIEIFSPAVAMFGGVSPQLGQPDVDQLRTVLLRHAGGADGVALAHLIEKQADYPLGIRPHEDGYHLAEDCLVLLDEPGVSDFVDVRAICHRLGIEVLEQALATGTIRGVALAGAGFGPTILINTTSAFNGNSFGKRFSIAHEFCHVIHDRSRARRVSHVSGPWVAPGIEKRANAFAAWFLMPRQLLLRHLSPAHTIGPEEIRRISSELQVNDSALIEHLYNIDFIGDWDRERLRVAFGRR